LNIPEPVFICSIIPEHSSDEQDLLEALDKLHIEDPSFHKSINNETGQILVSGMGELHLEIIYHKLINHYKIKAELGAMQIVYKSFTTKSLNISYTKTYGSENPITVKLNIKPTDLPPNFIINVRLRDVISNKGVINQIEDMIKKRSRKCNSNWIFNWLSSYKYGYCT